MSDKSSDESGAVAAICSVIKPFTDPVLKELGEYVGNRVWLWGSATRVARRARELAEASGEQPKAVPPKILIGILEGASIETDEEMIEYWARLLASASITQRVMPSFPRILSELTTHEAKLLDAVWDSEIGLDRGAFQIRLDQIAGHLGLTEEESLLMIENLVRLRLVRVAGGRTYDDLGIQNPGVKPNEALALTRLGSAFIEACRGPKATSGGTAEPEEASATGS